MKEVFFTFLAISLPLLAVGGVVYMFLHGLYRLVDDWRLGRELRQLRQETARHHHHPPATSTPVFDPLAAFDDQPPPPEPEGLITFPLDPDWELPTTRRDGGSEDLADRSQPVDPPSHHRELNVPPIVEPGDVAVTASNSPPAMPENDVDARPTDEVDDVDADDENRTIDPVDEEPPRLEAPSETSNDHQSDDWPHRTLD
jgi:hypothetical protein